VRSNAIHETISRVYVGSYVTGRKAVRDNGLRLPTFIDDKTETRELAAETADQSFHETTLP
jgi:hypothetical protein